MHSASDFSLNPSSLVSISNFKGQPRSKIHLGNQLHLPRSIRADDLPEVIAADVAVDRASAEELRVVKNIEGFGAELERLGC